MRKINRNMCEGPMLGNIILYTIPIILTSLSQLLFNAIGLVVVGRFCGSISVAAIGATSHLTNLIIGMFSGLSIGAGVTVAQSLGAGDFEKTHKAVHTAIPLALIGGAILTFIGIVFSKPILRIMDTPEEALDLAALYMRILFCGITFNILYSFGASILTASGDTKRPLIYLTIAGAINVTLNVIFVVALRMNAVGVALATIVSQAVSAILAIRALMKRHDSIYFSIKEMCIDGETVKKILKVGVPPGIQYSLVSAGDVIIQSAINSFGVNFVSGITAATNIEGVVIFSANAFQQTALNFSGQNYGAKRFDRIKKIMLICMCGAATCGLVLGSLTYIFGESLLSIYITDSVEAIKAGMIRFAFVALLYFICGITDSIAGTINGMGSTLATMLTYIFGTCGSRIIWIYSVFAIPKYHTPQTLFALYPISWTVTFVILIINFVIVFNKKRKKYSN